MEELEVTNPPNEPYFVDFMRDPPEPTGDEPEDADLEAPKVYEQVSQHLINIIIIWSQHLVWSTSSFI